MEFASLLAGERWTDHPACTHPLVAELARQVNDRVGDDSRQLLVPLVPSVIGLTSDDPRVDARLALLAASVALPVAPLEHQRALAVAVLTSGRVLAALEGRTVAVEAGVQEALDTAPSAARWAARFSRGSVPSVRGFRRFAAPHAVRLAAEGIAEASAPATDELLVDLLRRAVDEFPAWAGSRSATAEPRAQTETSTVAPVAR
jgi:hypothetical protein